jgi:hypothetical protein
MHKTFFSKTNVFSSFLKALRWAKMPLERKDKINLVSLIVLAGFIVSVLFHGFLGVCLHRGYPFNTFLFRPGDRFMDYFNGIRYVTRGHGAGMVGTSGLAYFMWWFLYLISFKSTHASFLIYSVTIVVYVRFYNLKNLLAESFPKMSPATLRRNLFILTFLSYPVLFTLDRGNIEGFVFILFSLFVYFFCSNRTVLSTVFLAGAAALKVYPVIFVILYLSEKRYKEAAIFMGILLVLSGLTYNSLTGLRFHLSSFISMINSSANPGNIYNALYVIGDEGAGFCSSAFGALKAAMYALDPQGSAPRILMLYRTYYWASLLVSALVALYVMFVEKELWKKIAILTLSMIFFPFVTGDYRLLHLYIPMWLFLNSRERSGADLLYSILFALLLIPKAYYSIKGEISISVILNPLIISVFMLSTIAIGLRNVSVSDITQSMRDHLTAARYIFGFGKVRSTGWRHVE